MSLYGNIKQEGEIKSENTFVPFGIGIVENVILKSVTIETDKNNGKYLRFLFENKDGGTLKKMELI